MPDPSGTIGPVTADKAGLELGDLTPQPVQLLLLWPKLTLAQKCLPRISAPLLDLSSKDAAAHLKVPAGLHHRSSALLNQPDCLQLELPAELLSNHFASPNLVKHAKLGVQQTGSSQSQGMAGGEAHRPCASSM